MASRTRREAVSPLKISENDSELRPRTRTRSCTKACEKTSMSVYSPKRDQNRSSKQLTAKLSERKKSCSSSSKDASSVSVKESVMETVSQHSVTDPRSSKMSKATDDLKDKSFTSRRDRQNSITSKTCDKNIKFTPPKVKQCKVPEMNGQSTPKTGMGETSEVRRSGRAKKSKSALELLGIKKIKKERIDPNEMQSSGHAEVSIRKSQDEWQTSEDVDVPQPLMIKTEPQVTDYESVKVEGKTSQDALPCLQADDQKSSRASVIVQPVPSLPESGENLMCQRNVGGSSNELSAEEKSPPATDSGNSPLEAPVLTTQQGQRTSRSGRVIASPRRLQDYSVSKDTPASADVSGTSAASGLGPERHIKRKRSVEGELYQELIKPTGKMVKLVKSSDPTSQMEQASSTGTPGYTVEALPVFKKEFIIGSGGKAGMITVRDKEPLKERVYPKMVNVELPNNDDFSEDETSQNDLEQGDGETDTNAEEPLDHEYKQPGEKGSELAPEDHSMERSRGKLIPAGGEVISKGDQRQDSANIGVTESEESVKVLVTSQEEDAEHGAVKMGEPVEIYEIVQGGEKATEASQVIVVSPDAGNGEVASDVKKTDADPDMSYYEMMVKLASEVVQRVEGYDKDLVYRVEYGEGKVTHMVLKKPDPSKSPENKSKSPKREIAHTKGTDAKKIVTASRKANKHSPVTSEELAMQESVFGLTAKGRKRPIKQLVVKPEFQELIDKLEPTDNIEDHVHNFSRGRSRMMTCKHCGTHIKDRHHFRKHIRTHPEVDYKPYACPLCSYKSQIKAAIARHINIHSDVMPYVCVLCGRGFNFKQKLQIHMKYHKGVRDQKCPHCDLAFHENKTLRNHMRAIHNAVMDKSKKAVEPVSVHGVLYPQNIPSSADTPVPSQARNIPQIQPPKCEMSIIHQDQTLTKQEENKEVKHQSMSEMTQNQHLVESVNINDANAVDLYCSEEVADDVVEHMDHDTEPGTNVDASTAGITSGGNSLPPAGASEESTFSACGTDVPENINQIQSQAEEDSSKQLVMRTPSGALAVQTHEGLSQDNAVPDAESQDSNDPSSNVEIWYEVEQDNKPRLRFSRCTGANKTRKITERYMKGITKFGASHSEIEATKPWKKSVKETPEPIEILDDSTEPTPKPSPHGTQPLVSMQQLDKTLTKVSTVRKVMMANKKLVSTYHCKICGLMFSSRTLIVHHIEVNHPDIRLWECPDCNYTCRLRSSLFVHRKLHEGPNKHDCKECGKTFPLLSKLKDHMLTHSQAMDYKCEQCGKNFRRKGDLKKHIGRIHSTERPLKCDMCEKSFRDKVQLRRHLESHVEGRTLLCEICLKYYKSRSSLQQHIKSHMCRFYCELCNKPFGSYSGFMAHKVMHTESFEGFSCDLCGKVLHTKGSLNRHLTISHSTARPYQCLQCKNAFKTKKDLRNHAVVHSSAKDFACSDCGFKSKRFESLQVHRRRHQEVKPYRCGVCGREYTQKRSLQMHLPYHLADLQIKCPYCKKRCMSKNALEQHIKRYHSDSQVVTESKQPVTFFMCEECNCVFLTQDNLAVHILVEHMQQPKDGATKGTDGQKDSSLVSAGLEYELSEVSNDINISREEITSTRKALEGISMGANATVITDVNGGKTHTEGLTYVAITDPKSQQQKLISLLNPVPVDTGAAGQDDQGTGDTGHEIIGQGIEDVEVEGEVIMNLEDALTEEALQHIKVEEVTSTEDATASEHVRHLLNDTSTSVVPVSSDNMTLAMSQSEAMDMAGDMSHGTVVSFLDPNTQETFSVSMPQQALENLLIPAMETEVSLTNDELSEAMVITEGPEVHVEEAVDYC